MNTTMKDSKVIAAHLAILKRFTLSTRDPYAKYKEWMCSPFNNDTKTIATDAIMLVAVPKLEGYPGKDIAPVYPIKANMDKLITRKQIEDALDKFPKDINERFDDEKSIQIGKSNFDPNLVKKLLFVATKLKSDIRLINQREPNRATLFAVQDVEVLLMPRLLSNSTAALKIKPCTH